MRPKTSRPAASRISIAIVSPTAMNGVDRAGRRRSVSSARRSTRHETPRARSAFDTVPLPRIVPAVNARVRAMWAMRSKNEKCISPGVGIADQRAVVGSSARGRWTRPSRQAAPSSSGVTANGENAVAGFDWKKPKPLRELVGHQVAQRDVVGQHQQPDVRRARRRRVVPCGVSPRIAATSLSKSSPQAGIGERDVVARAEQHARAALVDERIGLQRRGRRGAARLAHAADVVEERRPVDPLVGARQRRAEARDVQRLADRAVARVQLPASAASAGAARSQSSSAACSVGAIAPARAQRSPSRPTTTSAPSRVPSRSVASLMRPV